MAAMERRHTLTVWLLAAFLTCLTIIVHFASPSTIHMSEESWEAKIEHHQTFEIFNVRPLTNIAVGLLTDGFGLSARSAFFGLQFFLFFLMCPSLYFLFRRLEFDHRYGLAGMIVFALSLPVFLAHFEPLHTWSDFWVYLMAPLSLGLALRGSLLVSVLTLSIALIARETTFLFAPALFWITWRLRKGGLMRATLVALTPLVLFLVVRYTLLGGVFPDPLDKFAFNFDGPLRTSDTLFSIAVSLGFLWVIGLFQVFSKAPDAPDHWDMLRIGAAISIVGYVVSGLLYAQVRESRVFQPAALFLIPLVLHYVRARSDRLKRLKAALRSWQIVLLPVVLLIASIHFAKAVFPAFEYRPWADGNWAYLGFHITVTILFLWFEFGRKSRRG